MAASVTAFSLLPKSAAANDAFAQCLTNEGAVVYGAYWCPHCQDQKNMFSSSWQYINYVECDPNGENANPQLCQEKGIEGYPTWVINGIKYGGVMQLSRLSELTGCQL